MTCTIVQVRAGVPTRTRRPSVGRCRASCGCDADLRRHDNPALVAAAADAPVVPLFVLDPRLWRASGDVRRAWLLRSLRALDRSLDGALVVRHGDPRTVVPGLAAEVGAATVHVSADFAPYGSDRDLAVAERLESDGRALVRTGSPYAVAPGRVTKSDGTPYRVYTPFFRAWLAHGWRAPAADAIPELAARPARRPPSPGRAGAAGRAEVGEEAALAR